MLSHEQLHSLAFQVTEDLVKEYPHMLEAWKVILGGYVLPKLATENPADVAGNAGFEDLIAEYTPEKIAEIFAPREVVEVPVEVPVIVEKSTIIDGKATHRRIAGDIHRPSRKKRELTPSERDAVIRVFNTKQDLLDKDSKTFSTLVDSLNEGSDDESGYIYPLQLSGYWSSLCRWADSSISKRNAWIAKQIKRGIYSVTPEFSEAFVAKIKANKAAKATESSVRAKEHSEIKSTGERRKVIASELPPKEKSVEELDLSDLF